MKSTDSLVWIFILALGGYLGLSYFDTARMQTQIESLQKKVNALELKSLKPNRLPIATAVSQPAFRDQVFRSLQTLNNVNTPLDAKKQKRILLEDHILKVRDPSVGQDDAFYDLLGTLMDEDLIQQIHFPSQSSLEKSDRPRFRTIRQELIRFGVPPELIHPTPENDFSIVLKKSV